jgi:hypothetical protein
MRKEVQYTFEGASMTLKEIQRLVPALSGKSLRNHLAAGRDTRRLMLSHYSLARQSSSGKRNGAILKERLENNTTPAPIACSEMKAAHDLSMK